MQKFQMTEDSGSEEYDDDKAPTKKVRSTKRRKAFKDWRKMDGMNACKAYWTRNLRPNDYKIIHCFTAVHILVLIFGYLEYLAKEAEGRPHKEPIIATTVLHVMWCGLSLFGTVAALRRMSTYEIILLFISYIMIYAVGLYYLFE